MRIDFSKVETIDYEKINRINKAKEKERKEKERMRELRKQCESGIFSLPTKVRIWTSVYLSVNNILVIYLMNYCLPVSGEHKIVSPWGVYAGCLIGFIDRAERHNRMIWEGR